VFAVVVGERSLDFLRYVLRYDDSAKTVEFGIGSGPGQLNSGDAVGAVEGY
jgi:hypothetical protein